MLSKPLLHTTTQLLRRRDVEQLTGLSRSTIYRMMAANQFPLPVQVGAKAVAWRSDDIAAFIESRARRIA
ncbi:helix-turn-helix transcriptional regulator [Chitinilyticum litopenaei]|uniref:helix-turn-helix transcriptional regulator n=1 Tax=Chitinilyticum litopenaei TaxID=1121276 RepID=UPI000402B2B9|nr:AlpA family phage regulatory protein [Chitinilyticum litopenaei]